MTYSRGLAVGIVALAVGCTSTRPPEVAVRSGPPEPTPRPEPISMPEPSGEQGRIEQVDVFESAAVVPLLSVRMTGALFAASTRSAEPSRHPRAAMFIERTRSQAVYSPGGDARGDWYVLRLEQTPGGTLRITEANARQLLQWLEQLDGPGPRSDVPIAASEVRLDDVRLTFTPKDRDVVRLGTARFEALYVRRALAGVLKSTLFKLDVLRRDPTTRP